MNYTVKATGEVVEIAEPKTPEEIMAAWKTVSEYIKAWEYLKDQLKPLIPPIVDERGVYASEGYQFRVSNTQRMNYDKALMRAQLDPDVFDILLKPDKPAVDKYLKEHLAELGDSSTILRQGMLPEGQPYQTIRLEKINA